MKKESGNPKKFIIGFIVSILILVVMIVGTVLLFDPFYVYHKPLPGLKAVLTDKEYQCVGSLRHFDYDAVICGSSVCENYDNTWFDQAYGCKSIKAIRSYGATADLNYLLDIAFEEHEIKTVFYNIDPSSLSADPVTTYESTGCPIYLYDKKIWNDYPYIFNKDVLFKKIPYMIANSFSSYEEGNSYNWAQWKYFGYQMALQMYDRPEEVALMQDENIHEENRTENIKILTDQIERHPETTFKLFFSPYSMLWWDSSIRTGERDSVLYDEEKCIETLLAYGNVEIYFYQDDEDIITNLDNYMDMIHFSKEINYQIFAKMAAGEDLVTKENYKELLEGMRVLSDEIESDYIKTYFD